MDLIEIENYEKLYDIRLPEHFRRYLLTVSSETIGSYSYKIELKGISERSLPSGELSFREFIL
jgi:hypothetical protein